MSNIKVAYAASVPIGISLANLASSALGAQQSNAVDNSANLYDDAIVQVKVRLVTGAPANDKQLYVYVAGSEDGSQFTDNATGVDGALTLRDPTNLKLIGTIQTPDSGNLFYVSPPLPVAAAFGWLIPRKWSVVIRNFSGLALTATPGDHSVTYTGITIIVA